MRTLSILFIVAWCSANTYAQKWLQRSDFGSVGRHRASALTIGNKGYMGIGHTNGTGTNIVYQDWWQYDPSSNSWTQKADYPVPNYAASAFATDTKGYIGGGTMLGPEFFEYDPLTNTWSPIANCPMNVADQTAFAVNNKGYVIEGNQCVEYNPGGNSWMMKNAIPFFVGIWATSFVIDGSAYVKSNNQLYEYKASIDTWIPRATCPGVATAGSSSFTLGGKGYVVSGYIGALSELTKEVWEYNPGNNTWIQLEDFEGSARRFSCGITIQDRGYFGIGTNGINFHDWWAFDESSLSIKEFGLNCTVFPNPASNVLKIERESNGKARIELIDETGRKVLSETFDAKNMELDVSAFPKGSYKLLVFEEEKPIVQKTIQLIGS
jgi:N-acetylneuraminic acid mutarotase